MLQLESYLKIYLPDNLLKMNGLQKNLNPLSLSGFDPAPSDGEIQNHIAFIEVGGSLNAILTCDLFPAGDSPFCVFLLSGNG